MQDRKNRSVLGDQFDREIRSIDGLPDTWKTAPKTVRGKSTVLELSQTFIIQTFRQKGTGDKIFLEYIGVEGSLRIVLPDAVAKTLRQQSRSLTKQIRREVGRENYKKAIQD